MNGHFPAFFVRLCGVVREIKNLNFSGVEVVYVEVEIEVVIVG